MIPKIIHYCWFGRGELPAMAKRCLDSWQQHLPDFRLHRWDEDTFNLASVPYVQEAYNARKYAFVTDYVRLYALYSVGGVYMDTDVEMLKPLDNLLHLPGFSGFESETEIPTGIMAAEQHSLWAAEQLAYYDNRHFLRPDGTCDLTTNVEIISGIMASNGFVLRNGYQVYRNCMHIFPKDYFCPKARSGLVTLTPNTYCIHHFNGSWQPMSLKLKKFIFRQLIGPRITNKLILTKRFLLTRLRAVLA